MLIKSIKNTKSIKGLDNTTIKELFQPYKSGITAVLSIAHASLRKNKKSLPHKLWSLDEWYFIISGEGIMHIEDETAEISTGDLIFIPDNSVQFIENCGDEELTFLCIVSPPWDKEEEILC